MARVHIYSSEKEIEKKFVVPKPHNVVIGKFINLSANEMKFFYPKTDTTLNLKCYIKKYKINTNFIVNVKVKESGYSEIIIDSIYCNSNEVKNQKKYNQIQNLPPTFFEEYFEKNYINELLGCKVKYISK